jgi:hypothetical protein
MMQIEPVVFRLGSREAVTRLLLAIPGVFIVSGMSSFAVELFRDAQEIYTKISIAGFGVLLLTASVAAAYYGVHHSIRVLWDRAPKLEFQREEVIDHRQQRRFLWGTITHHEFSMNSTESGVSSAVLSVTACDSAGENTIKIDLCGLSTHPDTIYLKFVQFLTMANAVEEAPEPHSKHQPLDQRSSFLSPEMDTDVTVYSADKPAGWRALGIAVLIFASIAAFYVYTTRDDSTLRWTGHRINLTGSAVFAGIYYAGRALLRLCRFGPQLRLSPDGILDNRTRTSIRWQDIRNKEYFLLQSPRRGWQKTRLALVVLHAPGMSTVEIDLRDLSESGDEIAQAIDTYAAKYCS